MVLQYHLVLDWELYIIFIEIEQDDASKLFSQKYVEQHSLLFIRTI